MLSFTRTIVFLCVAVSAFSFSITTSNTRRPLLSTQLNIFGKAFANDQSLGKAENPGLKNGPNVSEVTINGKPVKAVAGQKVSQVLAAAKVKVTYSCRKGDCGTCELFMNGRVEKACNAKIPQGKCVIQTN
jgi:ferredoxin